MARFTFHATGLDGLTVVERQKNSDSRGFFERLFCAEEFGAAGVGRPIAQINRSFTAKRGAVRGLHFQRGRHAEAKFVTCLHGEVFDVAVDLRRGSPTFMTWFGATLSAENQRSLFIPEGFAHGFQTLTPDCELLYLHSVAYAAEAEGGLHPLEPKVGVDWPLKIEEMSEKDASRPFLPPSFEEFMP